MNKSIRGLPLSAFSLAVLFVVASTAAQAQTDPPARVGRLAFTEGSVSFHDQDDSSWSKAVINTPLTSGDAVWTEPNARSELSLAGTRVRLDGGTQLEMLAIDDGQTQLQIDQGRLDIKTYTMDTQTPYRIVTPRGTITLQQQGDYYVEAGSTQDATRLGVRSGGAQITSLNGQTLAVRAGEVGEIDGDAATPQLHTIAGAPPPPVAYWAERDRTVGYDAPPQYLSTGMTGYEDLNGSGTWTNDSQYGQVWSPRSVASDWQPYRSGHWSDVKPWGWTWVDDQPWGYAPYHYGRWAQRDNRWFWVPPQREAQPVYAPALVAFIGGVELSVALGNQSNAPVGWFPLGPRETYVPSYTTNRDYYNRINHADQIQQAALDDRWQRAQRHEAPAQGAANAPVNQRFAVVVPADTFVRSQPVARAALKVAPEKLAAAPVALVAAPPAPTASLSGHATATAPAKPADAQSKPTTGIAPAPATTKTAIADMPTLAKPATPEKATAPGPKIATAPASGTAAPATATPSTKVDGKAAPSLQPRTGPAPPKLSGATTPATPTAPPAATHTPTPATAPATSPATPLAKPPEASKPEASKPEASKPEATKPAEPAKAATPPPAPSASPQTRTEPAKPATAPHDATKNGPEPSPVREAQPAAKAPEAKAPEAKAPELRAPGAKPPELAKVPESEKKPAAPATTPTAEEKKDEKK